MRAGRLSTAASSLRSPSGARAPTQAPTYRTRSTRISSAICPARPRPRAGGTRCRSRTTGRRLLGRWGIDDEVQVIAYDQGNGAYAARLWWLMRWAGHTRVAVLDGGYAAWLAAGLAVTAQRAAACRTHLYTPHERIAHRGGRANHARAQTRADLLVDARGADRFAGENESIDPRGRTHSRARSISPSPPTSAVTVASSAHLSLRAAGAACSARIRRAHSCQCVAPG